MKKIRYVGREAADTRFHDGALRPVAGARHIQVLRANRECPELAEGTGWTYNHAPMLCYWSGFFYLLYLSSPVHEHGGMARVLLTRSPDGYAWEKPRLLFEDIAVPPGVYRGGRAEELLPGARTVAHHRMGFYAAENGVLLAMTHLGVTPDVHVMPNSGYGMGRVARRIFPDGTLGPVCVLRINAQAGWKPIHFPYPLWEDAEDEALREACARLLGDPLATGAWWEEERLDEAFFPLKGIRAPSFCPLEDGTVAVIGKDGLFAMGEDGGRTWTVPEKAAGIFTSGGKCWMQRKPSGGYVILYNPSPDGQHRWPLAAVTSEDGRAFDHMLAAGAEVPPMRYGGLLKNHGLNYIRGIMPGNGAPPDGGIWAAYSMNKEDIWVVRLPAELTGAETEAVDDDFSAEAEAFPGKWHVYSPLWASVRIESGCLVLRDGDPCDCAKAVRAFPRAERCDVAVRVSSDGARRGALHMELEDEKGMPAARVILDGDGRIRVRAGNGEHLLGRRAAGEAAEIRMEADCAAQSVRISLDGQARQIYPLMCPTLCVERLTLRTGEARRAPSPEDNLRGQCSPDISGGWERLPEAVFRVRAVRIQ